MPFLESRAPEIEAESWINSEPLSVEEGTYLLDFWSSSCPGCIQKLEMMGEIHEKYPLTVIGIHSPDFGFEKELENVTRAVEKLGIEYPVALDTGELWDSYSNGYWPSSILVHNGEIVWKERGSPIESLEEKLSELLGVEKKGIENTVEDHSRIHLGYRNGKGVNEEGNFRGEREFSVPERRKPDQVYLDGTWRQDEEFLEAGENAQLFFYSDFSAVSIVAHPGEAIKDVEIAVDNENVSHSEAGDDLRVEDRSFLRLKHPGIFSVLESMTGRSEIVLEPDRGTRIYSLDLVG